MGTKTYKEERKMLQKFKKFLKETNGDAVVWIVLIIISVTLAVIVWQNIGEGVKNAAKSMNEALSGK